jgi:hypothetical protein
VTAEGGAADGSGALTLTGRVPVEHRFFGLDRRSLPYGLVVIALLVLWTIVLPAVNGVLDYSQETQAGDVFALADGVTMDAQAGWGVDSGLLTTDKTASGIPGIEVVLVKSGVSFSVTPGPFSGSARELLGRIEKVDSAESGDGAYHVSGEVQTFQTNDGHPGVAQAYTTVGGAGIVAALVYRGTGLKITFTGPTGTFEDQTDEVGNMIASIRDDKATGAR